jgi:hypothetical protein
MLEKPFKRFENINEKYENQDAIILYFLKIAAVSKSAFPIFHVLLQQMSNMQRQHTKLKTPLIKQENYSAGSVYLQVRY